MHTPPHIREFTPIVAGTFSATHTGAQKSAEHLRQKSWHSSWAATGNVMQGDDSKASADRSPSSIDNNAFAGETHASVELLDMDQSMLSAPARRTQEGIPSSAIASAQEEQFRLQNSTDLISDPSDTKGGKASRNLSIRPALSISARLQHHEKTFRSLARESDQSGLSVNPQTSPAQLYIPILSAKGQLNPQPLTAGSQSEMNVWTASTTTSRVQSHMQPMQLATQTAATLQQDVADFDGKTTPLGKGQAAAATTATDKSDHVIETAPFPCESVATAHFAISRSAQAGIKSAAEPDNSANFPGPVHTVTSLTPDGHGSPASASYPARSTSGRSYSATHMPPQIQSLSETSHLTAQIERVTPSAHIISPPYNAAINPSPASAHAAPPGSISLPASIPAVLAGPAHLEVGILDMTHGWLKVCAESGEGGGIRTYLTVNTPSHDALRAAMPEIAGYLQSEGINIARLEIIHSSSVGASPSTMMDTSSNSDPGSDAQPDAKTFPEQQVRAAGLATEGEAKSNGGSLASANISEQSLACALSGWRQPSAITGGWLSICA